MLNAHPFACQTAHEVARLPSGPYSGCPLCGIGHRAGTMNPAELHRLSPERWRTLEPLLDAAMALPSAQRGRFLDEACRGDTSLRAELASMIAECERSDPILDSPAIERFAYLLEDASVAVTPPPQILAGRFRLDRELGRGGM